MTRTRQIVTLVAVLLCCLAPVATGAAVADPGDPVTFQGEAEDADGNPLPTNATVVLAVDGTAVDDIDAQQDGVYAEIGNENRALETQTDAGNQITFHVGSVSGATASETVDLSSIDSPNGSSLNLTFPSGTFDVQLTDITLRVAGVEDDVSIENGSTASASVTSTFTNGSTSDVTSAANYSITDSAVATVDSSGTITAEKTGSTTLTASYTGPSGIEKTDPIDITVTKETEDSGNGNGNGPSPGGPTGPGEEDGADDEAPPTVTEVRNTLNLVEPTTDTSTEITDADPDTPGVTVTPEGTESVSSITFDNEDVTGSVTITEYNDPPQQIRDDVAASVTEAGAVDTGGADGGTVNVISVADITPDNEAAEESSATVTLSVPRDEVNNPERVTVIKETYSEEQQQDTWSQLETTLEEVSDEQVTVSAQAESFSLFAVTEIEPADDQQQQQQDEQVNETDQPDEPADDGGPGAGLIIGLLVVVAVVGAAVYLYSQQE